MSEECAFADGHSTQYHKGGKQLQGSVVAHDSRSKDGTIAEMETTEATVFTAESGNELVEALQGFERLLDAAADRMSGRGITQEELDKVLARIAQLEYQTPESVMACLEALGKG